MQYVWVGQLKVDARSVFRGVSVSDGLHSIYPSANQIPIEQPISFNTKCTAILHFYITAAQHQKTAGKQVNKKCTEEAKAIQNTLCTPVRLPRDQFYIFLHSPFLFFWLGFFISLLTFVRVEKDWMHKEKRVRMKERKETFFMNTTCIML